MGVADTGEAGGRGEIADASVGFALGLGAAGDGVGVFEDAGVIAAGLAVVAVVVLDAGDALAAR